MRDELYHKNIRAGSRTYHISVNKTIYDKIYLKISQIKKDDEDNLKKVSVLIFEEDLAGFLDIFNEALELIVDNTDFIHNDEISNAFQKYREIHNKAYMPWTLKDDILLEENNINGLKIDELSKLLNRSKGSIKSRIKKLGLQNK